MLRYLLRHARLLLLPAICASLGCANAGDSKRVLVWDLSNGRSTAALKGGIWVGPQPNSTDEGQTYHVTGIRGLSISVILSRDQRFDFTSIADAYATKRGTKVRTVDIASFGYSEQEVIQQLADMHKRWNGMGIGDIDKWKRDITINHDLGPHITVIHKSTGPDDPSITAAIHTNFGGANNAWYIMVTFFWNTP